MSKLRLSPLGLHPSRFLVATLFAFALLEDERPPAAGVAGIIATTTRPVGPPAGTRGPAGRTVITEGNDRSCSGIMNRNRLQASQAQNEITVSPSITGPAPQSYCSQFPGSVIQSL